MEVSLWNSPRGRAERVDDVLDGADDAPAL